ADALEAARRRSDRAKAALDALWPERSAAGMPLGTMLLRGYRSPLDGSAQPYMLYAPHRPVAAAPLLVALHDLDGDEGSFAEQSSLAAQCEARGWVALCPNGRGRGGYVAAGERDVLDAMRAVRSSLALDAKRMYLTGLGLGGTGTWLLVLRNPRLFAAACPVS